MCDIEDVVRKITAGFNILNSFCPRLSRDFLAQEHKARECMLYECMLLTVQFPYCV